MSSLYKMPESKGEDESHKRRGPDYSRFRGAKVVLSMPAHPHYFAMMKLLPQFTKETGIRVEVERMDIKNIKSKQMAELKKEEGDFDLISYVVMWKTEYVKKKLLLNLEPFFRNQIVCAHAYGVNNKIFDNIIYMGESSGMEIDNFYAKVLQHMSYNNNQSGKYNIRIIQPFNQVVQDKNFISNIQD